MRRMLVGVSLLATMATVQPASAQAAPAKGALPTWLVDKDHSDLSFRIRHLNGRVSGTIAIWHGTIALDPRNLASGKIDVYAYPATIDTQNEERDEHLRSADFFDIQKYPVITFKSRSVAQAGQNITLTGDLTIKGITKPVTLTGKYNGVAKDARGRERIGVVASTKINRQEFGLTWNRLVEGMTMVGDDVEVEIALEAVKKG